MYSLSKTSVSVETAQQIVRHHLGSRHAICTFEELKDGFFNAAYQIEYDTRDQERWARGQLARELTKLDAQTTAGQS